MVLLDAWLPRILRGSRQRGSRLPLAALALSLAGPARAESACQDTGYQEASAPTVEPRTGPFVFVPVPGMPGLAIPRAEQLVYRAYIDLSIASTAVGTVTQTCSVAEQALPLVLASPSPPSAAPGETASIKLEARGGWLLYKLESTLETRVLPQDWPRLSYLQVTQSSRGTRRREVLLGKKEGAPVASYRGDTDKGAPKGTRIWRAAQERPVPEGTIDLLTAVFMARTLIREQRDSLSFPLIDKTRLWNLVLRRGAERRVETGAGTFDAVEVVLEPAPYPGESFAEKAAQFEGVFGINGSIHLWVEKRTGVAVRIQGDLPVNDGMITLGIDVVLDSYSGTPSEFAPLPPEKKGSKEDKQE
jgi:hypothetical protein